MTKLSKENIYGRDIHKAYYKGKDPEKVVGLNWGLPFYDDIKNLPITSICDVGCGNGKFLNDFSSLGYKNLYGVDIITVSEKMVIENKDIQYFSGPASSIPLEDKSIDLLTSFECLEHIHIDEVDNVLKEFNRITKGYFMFSIAHTQSPDNLHLCVKSPDWWIKKISKYATRVTESVSREHTLLVHNIRSQTIWKVK
jgi:ubiquinone/menaquinone biosynthesis C-methylase UbiE